MDRGSDDGTFGRLTVAGMLAGPELPKALTESFSDRAVTVLRATLGNLPVGGALVAELVGYVIPNQREERLCTFLAGLARKVEATNRRLEELMAKVDAEKVALFEDGAAGAVKATTDERIQQLVELVANGLDAGGREAEDQRALVRLLNDLTEADLRYLMLWTKKYYDDREWRQRHGFDYRFEEREREIQVGDSTEVVMETVLVGDQMDPIAEMAIQGRLVSLGLFEQTVVPVDPPIIDSVTGAPVPTGHFEYNTNISEQGLLLLRRLKLIDLDDHKASPY